MARNIKTGDQVMVIAGAAKGKTGRVLKILSEKKQDRRRRREPRVEARETLAT